MAYKKEERNEWKQVKGMDGFSVIGTEERFSISFEVSDEMRITINGCRIVRGGSGKNAFEFVSFPSWKAKDGTYHKYASITLASDEIDNIVATLD